MRAAFGPTCVQVYDDPIATEFAANVDRERDWIQSDLLFVGTATGYVDVNRPAAPRHAANATGDSIVSDGVMTVVQVGPAKTPAAGPPQLNTR